MTDRETKAIEAAELLREYCCLQRCTDCVFNFTNMKNREGDGCMCNGVDAFPSTWETHLIEKDWGGVSFIQTAVNPLASAMGIWGTKTYRGAHGNSRLGRLCKTTILLRWRSGRWTKNPLPLGMGSVKLEANPLLHRPMGDVKIGNGSDEKWQIEINWLKLPGRLSRSARNIIQTVARIAFIVTSWGCVASKTDQQRGV